MRPKILKVKGLNSFVDMQNIDFSVLTSRGLFGIFGPTGSGKSSILDAITLALYGTISRGNGEYINTACNEVFVSYEFEILNDGVRKDYLVERKIKKDKKGKYKTSVAKLIEKVEEESLILGEGVREVQKYIEEIIGLTAEDFTRSVVLPQGKFSEFLKLSGKDRRDMLERIFGLQKYGENLYKKIRVIRKKAVAELDKLEGQLKYYEDISDEKCSEIRDKLNIVTKEENDLRIEENTLSIQYEKYKSIWELNNELSDYKNTYEKLNMLKEDIKIKKTQIEKYEKAISIKVFIDNFIDSKNKVNINNKKLSQIEEELKTLHRELEQLEDEYKAILEKKDTVLPKLIKKQSDIQQAININERLKKVNVEREQLKEEYIKNNSLSEKLNLALVSACKEVENIKELLVKQEKQLEKVKVPPQYKKDLQKAYLLENRYCDILKRKNNIEKKYDIKIKDINTNKKNYEDILNMLNEKTKLVEQLKEKKQFLLDNCPLNEEELISLREDLVKLNNLIEQSAKNLNLKDNILKEMDKLNDIKGKFKKDFKNVQDSIMCKEKLIKELKNQLSSMEKSNIISCLIKDLHEGRPCPLCGSMSHPSIAKVIDNTKLSEKQGDIEKELLVLDDLKDKEREIDIKIAKIIIEEDKLKEQLQKINSETIEDIDQLLESKKLKEIEFNDKKEEMLNWNKEKENILSELEKEDKNRNDLNIKFAQIKESLSNDEKILEELKKERLNIFEEFNLLENQYFNLKNQLGIEDIKLEVEKINHSEKNRESLENDISTLREKLNSLVEKKEIISKQISDLDSKLSGIIERGKEKSGFVKSYQEDIKRLSEGKDLFKYANYLESSIKDIQDRENGTKEKLNFHKEKFQKAMNEKIVLEKEILALNKRIVSEEALVKEKLEKNNFISIEEVKKSILSDEYADSIKKEIEKFQRDLNNTLDNIKRIENKLNGEFIEEDFWENFKQKKANVSDVLYKKIREKAALEKDLKNIEADLKNVGELIKVKKDVQHKKSLLDELDKLVEGNKFVEFVASGQLKYIAIEASKRLKSITNDRYSILLDPNGNFVIRDDKCGGVIRATSTLSGGETFLASLCLALALSSQIQLKGSAPLEFFFLDEGFGTLDNDLLDTVISSLEKLHTERLSIGIISHVDELKNRVPIKLIVNPMVLGENGSRVEIEYT